MLLENCTRDSSHVSYHVGDYIVSRAAGINYLNAFTITKMRNLVRLSELITFGLQSRRHSLPLPGVGGCGAPVFVAVSSALPLT